MTQHKNILVFRPLPEDQLARLQAAHDVTVADPRKEPEAASTPRCRTAHGLIGSSHPVDAALLARAPQLEVISSVSVGVDNYPLAELHAARHRAVPHARRADRDDGRHHVRAAHGHAAAAWSSWRNLVREGRWTNNIDEELFGSDVHGKTLGILGFGRIGQAVARRAALGFGMPVLYHARRPVDLAGRRPSCRPRHAHAAGRAAGARRHRASPCCR